MNDEENSLRKCQLYSSLNTVHSHLLTWIDCQIKMFEWNRLVLEYEVKFGEIVSDDVWHGWVLVVSRGWHCVICWHMKDKCSLLPPFILMHTPSLILHFNMKLSVKYYLHICIFFIHPSFISRLLSFFSLHGNIFCWELFSVTEWINEKTQNPELLF